MSTTLRRQVGWYTLLAPLLLLGKRKLPPPRLTSTFPTALTAPPTRHCSSKRRSSKESASAGSFTSVGGAQWHMGYGSPSPGRQTPEQIRRLRDCLLISVARWPYQVWGENGTHLLHGMITHDSHECIFRRRSQTWLVRSNHS